MCKILLQNNPFITHKKNQFKPRRELKMVKIQIEDFFIDINNNEIEKYLSEIYDTKIKLKNITQLGTGFHAVGCSVDFEKEGEEKKLVMRIVRGDTGWGHDYVSDRAGFLIFSHNATNKVDKSGRSVDVAGIRKDGKLVSLGDCSEFVQFTEFISGKVYADFLFELGNRGSLTKLDKERANFLIDYLVDLHSLKAKEVLPDTVAKNIYMRHLRDLIGHGELLMGVLDTYPHPDKLEFTDIEEMASIEKKCVEWRWKLKYKHNRLARMHGDPHPWNIQYLKEDDPASFVILDRSRNEWGDPADDVTCLTINYIFIPLLVTGEYITPFRELFEGFYEQYLAKTGDDEILKVLAPFFAFRGFVVIHPLYYPDLELEKRRKILNFVNNVLSTDEFDPKAVDSYLR